MTYMLCVTCAPGAAITDISTPNRNIRIGEIQKAIIQRTRSGGTQNEIVIGTSNPEVLATWTALKSAVDSTRVQVTPYFDGPESEAGGPREFGGPGETRGGIPIRFGRENTPFQAMFYRIPQEIIVEMKKYECEPELSVFLINECGQIIGKTDDPASPTNFYGFPIQSFFVGDMTMGQYQNPDGNMVQWNFLPNWSDNLHIVTPTDFNALVEL